MEGSEGDIGVAQEGGGKGGVDDGAVVKATSLRVRIRFASGESMPCGEVLEFAAAIAAPIPRFLPRLAEVAGSVVCFALGTSSAISCCVP